MFKNNKTFQGFFDGLFFNSNFISALTVIFALLAYFVYNYSSRISFGFFVLAFFMGIWRYIVAQKASIQIQSAKFTCGIANRIVEFLIILTLFNIHISQFILQNDIWLLIILFFGTGMTSFVKAYAVYTKAIRHEQAVKISGMLERMERSFLLLISYLFVLLDNEYLASIVLMFTAILCVLTFFERFVSIIYSET
ncbi:MAG: hypothetical protein AB1391_00865 [Candidatus Micrarchaeota archaeon]